MSLSRAFVIPLAAALALPAGETSATLVELPGAPQLYAWRVYAVARSGAHYASSTWNSFSIGKAGAD